MSRKIIHYSIDEIDKLGANVNLIWGERSNGKSYQVKHKKGVIPYLEDVERFYEKYYDKGKIVKEFQTSGKRFILMRRFKEEINSAWIESYFSDVDIEKLTDGEYNMITLYRKEIYLTKYDIETHKSKRGAKIGYAVSLSTEQNYAGGSYLDVSDIIFEEFMSRTTYLHDEPNKLLNFYSTVDRKRGTTKLWLVGNTISRVCPYLTDWNLQPILRKMKQGDIEVVEIPTENNVIRLGIEYCKSSGGKQTTFGQVAKMIETGSWQTDIQPKLPKSLKEYEQTFKVGFQYSGFRFVGVLLIDKKTKELVWFIYPRQREFTEKNMLVFSDCIKQSQYWQRNIYNLTFKNERLERALSTFRESNIFYSDDLTGTDFKSAIDFSIIK